MLINQALPIPLSSIQRKYLLISLSFLSFLLPFSLGSSQLVTGTFVNAALFVSALLLPSKLFLPVIFLPSLAVLSRGLIFGPLTHLLFFMVPFIWLGNFVLVLIFKKTYSVFGFWLSLFFASFLKTLVLFSLAKILFQFQILPRLFLTTMGLNQLITALCGGLAAYLFLIKFFHGKLNS